MSRRCDHEGHERTEERRDQYGAWTELYCDRCGAVCSRSDTPEPCDSTDCPLHACDGTISDDRAIDV